MLLSKSNSKSNLIIASGTLIEWAEFSYFAYILKQISAIFFPHIAPNLALLGAFTLFAVSYIARPISGLIFGILGDIYGRKIAMYYSMIAMGIASTLLGAIPSYAQIGIMSPILLMLCRLVQGFAVAGEFCGSSIYLLETNLAKPYLSSSLTSIFAALGMFLGAFMAVVISIPNLPSWAWRVPFILSGVLCIIATYARYLLPESSQFLRIKAQHTLSHNPLIELITKHKIAFLQTFLLASFVGIYIYICNIWWINYISNIHVLNLTMSRIYGALAQALVILFIFLFAILAEKLNNRLILRCGLLGSIIASYSLFSTYTNNKYYILAITLYALANAAVSATMFKYLCDIFPIKLRSTGESGAWNIAVAIFGGTAPLIAQSLSNYTINYVIIYITSSAILALISTFIPANLAKNKVVYQVLP